MTGEGEFSNREGHLTLDMSDLGGGAFGDGTAELTFSELVYYMKLPQGAGLPLPPGKEWFKIDLKQLGQTQGLDLEQLTQLSYENILETRVAVGTAPALIDRLGALRDELGLTGLVAELNPGGLMPLERMQRTLRILTHEVIPAFR